MKLNFDLVVIGGGSGGIACARRASEYGAKVALIEGDRLGGTCVIRGCIPKKLMMYASTGIDSLQTASSFCWERFKNTDFYFNTSLWQKRKTAEINRLEVIYENLLNKSNVQIFRGFASISNENEVEVNNIKVSAKRIVIATGGKASQDAVTGLKEVSTSNEILDLEKLPENLAVLGSGYIAVEFASILSNFGIDVSLFFRADLPLRGFDEDIRKRLFNHLESSNVLMHPNSDIQRVEKNENKFYLTINGKVKEFDDILNALGRKPNIPKIDKNLKILRGNTGQIAVDEFSKTSIPNIFAIGDVTDRLNLTPVAIAEGRALAENEFNGGKFRGDHLISNPTKQK